MRKLALSSLMTVALAIAVTGSTASTAAAYGNNAVYQIAFSGNCDDPSFPLCAPPPAGFGVGGFWVWVELDNDGTGDVAGAGCQHGLPTPPHGGAENIRGDVTWTTIHSGTPPPFAFNADPQGNYLVIPQLGLVLPATQGHYSFNPAPAVTAQTQIVKIPNR